MRIFASIIALLAIFAAPQAHAFPGDERGVYPCAFPNAPEIQELNDARFLQIFVEVVQAFKLDVSKFALCTSTVNTTPGTIPKQVGGQEILVVAIPRYVLALSTDAARGLLGHEFGHVVVGFRKRSTPYEILVDLHVAWTIGYDAILACHKEMPALLETHVPYQYMLGGRDSEIIERVNALHAQMNAVGLP
jgi:hypothetical protein